MIIIKLKSSRNIWETFLSLFIMLENWKNVYFSMKLMGKTASYIFIKDDEKHHIFFIISVSKAIMTVLYEFS